MALRSLTEKPASSSVHPGAPSPPQSLENKSSVVKWFSHRADRGTRNLTVAVNDAVYAILGHQIDELLHIVEVFYVVLSRPSVF